MKAQDIEQKLRGMANEDKAAVLRGFFKTGPGQYGEGDIFLGITVPQLRTFAKTCHDTPIPDCLALLKSRVHEQRLLALLLLIGAYSEGDGRLQKRIFRLYLDHTRYVNNWDLVDLSAPNIVGNYLSDKPRRILYDLAESESLWERRISIIATLYYIKQSEFSDTLRIARSLIHDEHDLIQKAVGWMLREVGKRDLEAEERFLKRHYANMPRTALRYAIERFPEPKRLKYLKGLV